MTVILGLNETSKGGLELRNELAVTFSLQVGDWICLEYDTYPNTYTDQKGCLTCATRLIQQMINNKY